MPHVSRRAMLGAGFASVGLGVAGVMGVEAPVADAAPVSPPCRSHYSKSQGRTFTATQGKRVYQLKLVHIRDIAGATAKQGDRCFNLVFSAAKRMPDGVYTLTRAGVPTHTLFLSRIGTELTMQALVNRSV
ncbi:MAG: hypothetical protein J0H43_04240 [Actinobacteria bacterium]|nr:hypothetical protein [Actinomycetota bacterium]